MTHLTINQACAAIGKSHKTIYRHLKLGKISAIKNRDGQYRFDPSELVRVYGELKENSQPQDLGGQKQTEPTTRKEPPLSASDKLIARLENEVTYLRETLAKTQQINQQLALAYRPQRVRFWNIFRSKKGGA